MFPSACPNRFFVKFSTTYLTDIAFGQLLSLLLHLPLFFSNKEREREKIAIERSNRMEAEREGRNFGESDKRTGEKEEEQKRGGGRAKRVKKEGERIACVSYRLRASSHLRACTHSRGHLSRTHTPCSLSLSLFIFIFLRRVTIIRNERERERERRKERNSICANFLIEVSKKRWVFAKRSKRFTSIVVKLTPRAGACCVLPTLSTTFSHDIARIRGFHLRSLSLSLSLSPAVYSTKRISTVNRPNKGVA